MTTEQSEKRSLSFLLLVVIFVLGVAQIFPLAGIFLMMLGVYMWLAILVQIFMVTLAVESYFRVISRYFLVVPVVFYGGYYGLVLKQKVDIWTTEARLQRENTTSPVTFDPSRQMLVLSDAAPFVKSHRILVAYQEVESMRSYRLVDMDDCSLAQIGTFAHIQLTSVMREKKLFTNACVLSYPASTSLEPVTVTTVYPGQLESSGSLSYVPVEGYTDIVAEGLVATSFKTAAVNKLSLFPIFYFGCGLNSSAASWDCGYNFRYKKKDLNTAPSDWRVTEPSDIIGRLLGIPKYTPAELENFKTDPSNKAFLDSLLKPNP